MLSKAEHTRGAILDAAQPLFIDQGYAATSMRQIAKNARLALGSTYNHFPAKEIIFQTILNERNPLQAIGNNLTAVELDLEKAKLLLDEFDQHEEFFNLMLIELVEFKGKHLPELFENVLRDIPPPASWRAFLSLIVSYQITRLLLASTMPPGAQQMSTDAFIDLFLHGILKPE